LSLFPIATAAAVLTAGAAGFLALAGNLAAALALAGAALILVAVLQFLADRRAARASRTVLGEVLALRSSLDSLSNTLGSLGEGLSSLDKKSTLLGKRMAETAELARNQAEGAERRLLASIDAGRLEAAVARSETSAGAPSRP
jgi:hypothetical protein